MTDREEQRDRRVGEALSNSEENDADGLDPALVARLEAWFDGPATGMPAPSGQPAAPVAVDAPAPEPNAPRDRALAAVDPGLLGHLEDQGQRSAAMVEPLPEPEPVLDPSISRFNLARWRLQGTGDLREYPRPDEVVSALRERTPQAILRDLHRPVRLYGDIYLRPLDLGYDRTGGRARAQISELVCRRRYRIDISREHSAPRVMLEVSAELSEILSRPWEDSKPESPRPVPDGYALANDMKWFGSVGVDPDQ